MEDCKNISLVEVFICVAVSESGQVKVCAEDFAGNSRLKFGSARKAFREELIKDNRLWVTKTLKVWVPLPDQYEEIKYEQS